MFRLEPFTEPEPVSYVQPVLMYGRPLLSDVDYHLSGLAHIQ